MGLLDIFKKGKKRKADDKLKRPPKGVLKRPSIAKPVKPFSAGKPEKEEEKKPVVQEKAPSSVKATEGKSELASRVILAPLITEKSTYLSERNVFVFRVASKANKVMIKKAIKELYGFDTRKIGMISAPSKPRFTRRGGRPGSRSGFKKAVVYLKEGDKIDLA